MSNNGNEKTIHLAIKGFSWNVVGNLIRSITGFIVNIILARLLGPEPFGIIAVALLIISIGNLVIESGLGVALVQKEEIDKQDISFVFSIQMVFSLILAVIIVLLAPWIATQFSNPSSALVLQIMSIKLVFQGFAQVPSALLRREMKFKQIQSAQVISFLIGYGCVGLPLALTNYGVWSLVSAQLIQSGINAIILFITARHPLRISFIGTRKLAVFGVRILFANIANWIILNVDTAIVGRKFGTTNLGFYNRAYLLNWTPTGILLSSAQTALFSAVSRMGKNNDTLRIFRGFLNFFSIVFFSLYGLIALESTNIIQIIYGQEWVSAAKLLTPLAIAMPFRALVGLEGPVLNGLGKPQQEMHAQWITAVFAVVVLLIASQFSLEVTAWSILLIYIFRLLLMSIKTVKALETKWNILTRPILTGFLMESVLFLVWMIINSFLPKTYSPIVATSIRSLIAVAVWALLIWLGRSWILPGISIIRELLKTDVIESPLH